MTSSGSNSKPRQAAILAMASLLVAAMWLVVLPWLASQASIRERLDFLHDRGIDASAMYYTELEAMDPILERLEGREEATPARGPG